MKYIQSKRLHHTIERQKLCVSPLESVREWTKEIRIFIPRQPILTNSSRSFRAVYANQALGIFVEKSFLQVSREIVDHGAHIWSAEKITSLKKGVADFSRSNFRKDARGERKSSMLSRSEKVASKSVASCKDTRVTSEAICEALRGLNRRVSLVYHRGKGNCVKCLPARTLRFLARDVTASDFIRKGKLMLKHLFWIN